MRGHETVEEVLSRIGTGPLPVLLLEPDGLARRAVETLLIAHGFHVVAAVGDGREAITISERHHVGILVTEIALPDMPFRAMLTAVRAARPAIRAVVVTGESDTAVLVETLHAGVTGILSKYTPPASLMLRIASTFRDGLILDEITGPVVLRGIAETGRTATALPEREREVLELVLAGCSTATIGRRLGLAESTVKSHAAKAAVRLGAKTSKEAAEKAARHGLVAVVDLRETVAVRTPDQL